MKRVRHRRPKPPTCRLVERLEDDLVVLACKPSKQRKKRKGEPDLLDFELRSKDRKSTYATMQLEARKGALTVGGIKVWTEGAAGKGYGTKLYDFGLRLACRKGVALQSSSHRSVFAEAFWRKQAQKGRAVCHVGRGAAYFKRPWQGYEDSAVLGAIPPEVFARTRERLAPLLAEAEATGGWTCESYRITQPCALATLRGRR